MISLEQGLRAGAKVDKQIRDAGPREFVELFMNAEFVITDSFHGTCFALNFEIPFVSVCPKKHANRLESLLTLVGLEERLMKSENDISAIDQGVDFAEPTMRLNQARNDSLSFVEGALA